MGGAGGNEDHSGIFRPRTGMTKVTLDKQLLNIRMHKKWRRSTSDGGY